jgi:hypothetical protein
MFQDYDVVTLKREIVEVKDSTGEIVTVPAGSSGTVLLVYSADLGFKAANPLDYEVEFVDEAGNTLGILTVSEADLELAIKFVSQERRT